MIGEHESAKFWLNVLNDLKNRGVQSVYVFCVDGLTGFREAISSVYPKAQIQRCIIHQIRSSTKFVKIPFSDEKTIEGKGAATKTFVAQSNFGPIDASKADPARLELKMDIEIENLTTPGKISPFVYCEGQVELTSGGKPDKNEKSVNVTRLILKTERANIR